MNFFTALRLLTIIPLPFKSKDSPEEMGRSTAYFPIVGLLIGFLLVGVNALLGLFLPAAVVNGLLIVSLVVISGALHLDGLVDTCDGIAGHKPVEERWEVMHDSRAGAFGIVGVVLLLLLKYVLLNSVPGNLMIAALLLTPVVSRWAMAYALGVYPYARQEGLGKAFKMGASKRRLVAATAITLALAIFSAWLGGMVYYYLAGLVIMFGIWVIIILVALYLKRKFSGLTGDTYGAINEIVEVCVLIFVSVFAFNGWLI
ncbi:adenosylcobinamide-GDP ribazoletransferase [Chloroflexota bacterium]